MAEIVVTVAAADFDSEGVQELLTEWNRELAGGRPAAPVTTDEFLPPAGVFLLATLGGAPAGCGGLRPLGDGVAEVKRVFVSAGARGGGVARSVLDQLEARAREAGYRELRLDTRGSDAALALFRGAGFVPTPDYNGNPNARYWFTKDLCRP